VIDFQNNSIYRSVYYGILVEVAVRNQPDELSGEHNMKQRFVFFGVGFLTQEKIKRAGKKK